MDFCQQNGSHEQSPPIGEENSERAANQTKPPYKQWDFQRSSLYVVKLELDRMGGILSRIQQFIALWGKDPVIITLETGDVKLQCTDHNVRIICEDVDGNRSKTIILDNIGINHWKNVEHKFVLPELGEGLGVISCIEVWREGVMDHHVFLNVVFIKRVKTEKRTVFPINRWTPDKNRLRISLHDSSLPQNHENPEARRHELEWNQKVYKPSPKSRGLPVMCSTLPNEQIFSSDYQRDLGKKLVALFFASKYQLLTTCDYTTLADMEQLYTSEVLPLPKPAAEEWYLSDEYFAEQRLSGCNPLQIKLCTVIPKNFAVTSVMIETFLEGKTMAEALEEEKLFLTDYIVLKDLKIKSQELRLVAPLGLFYLTNAGKLLPVAIQLEQDPSDDNPVFLPSDPIFTWTIVKIWFNLADASVHQAKAHLGFTHMMVESICLITHRQLSPSHPVFRLLAPHFLYLMAINHKALETLTSHGGLIDRVMTMGRVGTFDIIRRTLTTWRMNVEGKLPADIQDRGVGPDILPHYPYRDDAMVVYDIIKDYVRAVIDGHYRVGKDLTDDEEIHAWVEEMTKPVADRGAGLQGVPGDGKLINTEDLIDIATFTIFTSSVQHAAVNFNQYEQYGFPAIYPGQLEGRPPTSKVALTEADLVEVLPSPEVTTEMMLLTNLLSTRDTKGLGHFEVQYGYDEVAEKAMTKFQEDLKLARVGFLERNSKRQYSYTVLDPAEIPNAISI